MRAPYYGHDPVVVNLIADYWKETPDYRVVRQDGSATWLLLLTLGGSGRLVHRDGWFDSKPGDCVLIRPKRMHEYGTSPNAEGWEFIWAHFHARPHWLPLLDWNSAGAGMLSEKLSGEVLEQVASSMKRCAQTHLSSDPLGDAFAMNDLERALILVASQSSRRALRSLDPRVQLAIDFMHREVGRPFSMERLAEKVRLSESRFAHLFAKETGLPPRMFAERLRIDRSRQLLELTDQTVRTISEQVGFANEFYFSQRFKALVGQSPGAYRSAIRKSVNRSEGSDSGTPAKPVQ